MGNAKKNVTKVFALCLTAASAITPISASAGQLLGETSFDKKGLPWHVCESAPGEMDFDISGGVYKATIVNPGGQSNGGEDRWDCQFRHRGLVMRTNCEYQVSFELTADKAGKFYTKIGDLSGDIEVWHNGNTSQNDFDQKWDCIPVQANQTYKMDIKFKPTQDLEVAEWAFHLGGDGQWTSGGCFAAGTTITFDNMSLINLTSDEDDPVDEGEYEVTGVEVNQVGYYPNLEKKATVLVEAGAASQEFKVVDASGNTVYTGTTGATIDDTAYSGNHVQVADFSECEATGDGFTVVCNGKTSLPFNIHENIYDGMFRNAMNYYYQNRSGVPIESQYITSGDASTLSNTQYVGHNPDTAYVQDEWVYSYKSDGSDIDTSKSIDVTGGWYDAGDHGKYVVNGGISVWTLNNIYERAVAVGNTTKLDDKGDIVIPEAGNGMPDILDETRIEMEFFLKMQRDDGMVYHKMHDYKWTALAVRPSEDDLTRIVKPVTTAATLNLAATAAQSYRLWKGIDDTFANTCLDAAKKAYTAAKADPENYAPMDQDRGGGAYGDTEVKDDFYWAACELYAATGDSTYYTDLKGYKDAFKLVNNLAGGENSGSFSSFNWGCTAGLGTLTLLLNSDGLSESEVSTLQNSIVEIAQSYVDMTDSQGYGTPYTNATYTDKSIEGDITGYEWGSNSFVINNAIVMSYAYDITGDMDFISGASSSMDYLLGRNPLEQSYVTGYGKHATTYPHHRYWSYQLDPTFPMAPSGVMSGGPNSAMQDPWIQGMGYKVGTLAPQLCYLDHIESWSTNEVTINWNAPFAWVVSYLEDVAPTAVEGQKAPYIDGSTVITPPESDETTVTTAESEKPSSSEGDTTTSAKETDEPSTSDTTSGEPGDPSKILWGDVTVDGLVDIRDVTLMNQYIVGIAEITPQGLLNGDVISDDTVDIKDLGQLKKFMIKLVDTLEPSAG